MTKLSEEEIEYRSALARTAAAWWAGQLRGPREALPLLRQAGHTSVGSLQADMLMYINNAGAPRDAIDVFEEALAQRLIDWCKLDFRTAEGRWLGPSLSTDYGPEGALGEVAIASGVSGFPMKTNMYIDESGIRVSVGYRGRMQHLCTTKREVVWDLLDIYATYPLGTEYNSPEKQAWEAWCSRVRAEHQKLPPFPEGEVNDVVRRIKSSAEAVQAAS